MTWLFVFLSLIADAQSIPNWPPVSGKEFPNIKMIDADGKDVELKSLSGTPLVIEVVGMSCQACQAFSGAHKDGKYGGITPQADLISMEELFPQYGGGIKITDSRFKFVQILFYNLRMEAPSKDDVAGWKKHFKFAKNSNALVFGAKKEFKDQIAFRMIPGFFLVDRDFILKQDSSGPNAAKLYTHLLPQLKSVLVGLK